VSASVGSSFICVKSTHRLTERRPHLRRAGPSTERPPPVAQGQLGLGSVARAGSRRYSPEDLRLTLSRERVVRSSWLRPLPIPAPVHRGPASHRQPHDALELAPVVYPPVIPAPRRLLRIAYQVRPSDMMVAPDLAPARTREVFLGAVAVHAAIRVSLFGTVSSRNGVMHSCPVKK
jgi:hypothetical protein